MANNRNGRRGDLRDNNPNGKPINVAAIMKNNPSSRKSEDNNNRRRQYNNQQNDNNNDTAGRQQSKKPNWRKQQVMVKKHLRIGESKLYNSSISELYNLLDEIPFDKVNIPVYMAKTALFGEDNGGNGTLSVGRVLKLSDDTFTLLINPSFADKVDESKCVVFIRCNKNYKTGEFTFIDTLNIVEGEPLESDYDDLYDMFQQRENEENNTDESSDNG